VVVGAGRYSFWGIGNRNEWFWLADLVIEWTSSLVYRAARNVGVADIADVIESASSTVGQKGEV
jgi:hypothetical protein